MISVQSLDPLGYQGDGSLAYNRSAPALSVDSENWKEVVAALISRAEMIVSEVPMLGDGARFELETCFQEGRWDRTVLVLPPLNSPFDVIDSDPLVQMFPRCLWADEFHNSNFCDSPVVADLIERLDRIADVADARRREIIEGRSSGRGLLESELPELDVRRIIPALEVRGDVIGLYRSQPDLRPADYDEYYDFWSVFRAAAIRTVYWAKGDQSFSNRARLVFDYLRMAQVMLHVQKEEELVIVTGDLVFAEQCIKSAYSLIHDDDPDILRMRQRDAEALFESAQQVQAAIDARPDVVIRRPRYGPFQVRKSTA
jgi:hypothetical protein